MSLSENLGPFESIVVELREENEQRLEQLEGRLLNTDLSSLPLIEKVKLAIHIVVTEYGRASSIQAIAELNRDEALIRVIGLSLETMMSAMDASIKQGDHRGIKKVLKGRAAEKVLMASNGGTITDLQNLSSQYNLLASLIPDYAQILFTAN